MFCRLDRLARQQLLLQLLLIFGLMLGPLGSLNALPIGGACADDCPCDATDVADPCDGSADEASHVKATPDDVGAHHDEEPDDDCADDCTDCDCDSGIMTAVTPASTEQAQVRAPGGRDRPTHVAPAPGQTLDIFIPPRP